MQTTTHRRIAVLGAVVVAIAAGCAEQPAPGPPVTPGAAKDLPHELTLTLEESSLDSPPTPILRTLSASLVSPGDIPLQGLKWPRIVLSEGAEWPRGWRVLPGDIPFGVATGGIPGGRRFTWQVNVLRTSASAPTEGDVSLWLEYAEEPGGPATRTTSAPVHIEFAAEAEPHPVTEQDVRDSNGNVFLMEMESSQGSLKNIIEIRPDGTFRSRPGAADANTETNGVLTESQRTRLRDALVDGRAWALLHSDADADPGVDESYINLAIVVGDAWAIRRGGAASFRSSADWLQISAVLTELINVEIPSRTLPR